eukprot:CAMPEP_0196154354 /NCGR_PEP_ID=MMETSP0910-20130528/38744_1 /TAXON_ID=49265 /ORGANISM="Thalassiosira rotula, Strain GSO102" /LENGTH=331 /DNA_ID=CAMNT_0041418353 /DNA_START=12 /DNA_END=1007 /DNA_ORIENTATION=-
MCDKPSSKTRRRRPPLSQNFILIVNVIIFFLTILLHLNSRLPSSSSSRTNDVAKSRLAVPGTAYRGTIWHNERTVAIETLGETKFARCDVHTVITEDGKNIIDDWLFLEETPAVNIIVQTLEGHFVVFNQKKYAIPGNTLSPVGGFIDEGESPLTAAKREVLEELGVGSRRTLRTIRDHTPGYDNGRGSGGKTLDMADVSDIITKAANPPRLDRYGLPIGEAREVPTIELDADWIFLGRYRTAANRGGGFLYSYLLQNAIPLVPGGGTVNYGGTGDGESQEILYLGEEEMMTALGEGRFQEIKWAATISLAMLHLNGPNGSRRAAAVGSDK